MVGKQKSMSTTKQISSLTYCIFSILFSIYFLYIKSFLLSSVFLIYSILFVSIYVRTIRKSDKFELKFNENHKHYLLSLGFMLTWLILYIIDLKSFFTAFEHISYLLLGATFLVISTLYFKLFIKP